MRVDDAVSHQSFLVSPPLPIQETVLLLTLTVLSAVLTLPDRSGGMQAVVTMLVAVPVAVCSCYFAWQAFKKRCLGGKPPPKAVSKMRIEVSGVEGKERNTEMDALPRAEPTSEPCFCTQSKWLELCHAHYASPLCTQ